MPMKPGLEKAAFKESVRPQDDLFRHVNGKWLDETEIPELPLASGKGSLEDGALRRHSTFEPAPEMMMATARADDFA